MWSFLRKFGKINIVSYRLGVLFFKEAAVLSNYLLEACTELAAALHQVGHGHGLPRLNDGQFQVVDITMRGLAGLVLNNAPHRIVEPVQIRTRRQPEGLLPEIRHRHR